MLFSTPTQYAVLALCLIAGWLFGLASHPGGRKWKDRYRAQDAEHRAAREGLTTRDARIHELERERDEALRHRDTHATPFAAGGTAALAGGAASTKSTGWFGWGRDNLSRIHGIDEATEHALRAEGIKTYAAIEALSSADETALEDRLGFGRGRIAQQQWREQASLLREGNDDEHERRWR